ncbi:toprim domain-containing protein [Nitrosovibrio sp. Nv4]|uniref:toprim domain-containing protein n=1 Tax=Nitrosovibrio sp. Nv4 TaxID=1945880 RepID=UPI000BD1F334|nr:toprim domain-containing protein [Nitrosovibrio sp. Nv4]SOD42221.1 putative DNA primase/helicase [Nitrosovibrio sp. Nv4]
MSPFLPPALIEFMHQHGYRPNPLKSSGSGFLRFPVGKEANGNMSGYVKLFPESEGAVVGDFKSGTQLIWSARDVKTLLPAERTAHELALKKVREELKEERCRLHAAAAVKAAEIYAGTNSAKADHPYLVRKCINPCGAIRQSGSQLRLPVYVEDKLTSLQFIEEDGTKRFLTNGEIKGGCCVLGTPGEVICIAEGYATGCSICEATGHAVAVAFNAGNLMHVAQAMRQRYKRATLILCADNDQWTEGNPGLTKATEAAIAVDALLAVPDFSGCDMSGRPTDFNDLHVLAGKEAVSKAISTAGKVDVGRADSHVELLQHLEADPTLEPFNNAIVIDEQQPDLQSGTAAEAAAKSVTSETGMPMEEKDMVMQVKGNNLNPAKQEDASATEDSGPLAPPNMPDAGFPPLMRDIVEAACDSSEAHPVAVAANELAYFSAMIGRGIYQRIGDVVIHCRPFPLIVGKSGKARKGTSESTVRKIFKRADAILCKRRGVKEGLRCHTGGLSTGEGIAWAIRDPVEPDEKNRGSDPGVTDKRLLAIESEFDNVLSQLRRDSNTLSAAIRNLFDGRDLEPLTKTSPTRATRPHVCILGHITGHELREKATANDVANGLLNRFLMLYVSRPKLVALPRPTPEARIEELAQQVADAIMAVTEGKLWADNMYESTFSDPARDLWVEHYPAITRDREGKAGSLLARSEMYARMLAMAFAAMDGRLIIEPKDLRAAFAWVEYWSSSVSYIFNCGDDDGALDPEAAKVFEIIKVEPGITLSELQQRWNNKSTKKVTNALKVLLDLAPPLIEERKRETAGRPARTYFVYGK